MFLFSRTLDPVEVHRIVTEPSVYRMSGDDGTPAREEYPVSPLHPAVWHVMVCGQSGREMGLLVFQPMNQITWACHCCLLPAAYGKSAEILAQAFQWIWKQPTGCRRIEARIPAFNRLALQLASKAGMMRMCETERSFMRGGELWNETLFCVRKPED